MFKINADLSIEITRGDAVEFVVTAKDNGENYVFKIGDVVRFKVFEKKGCDCVVLQKDFGVESDTEEVTIVLDEADTKIGQLINKPKDYWYEVELNPDTLPSTIIGYDEDGAKVFKLYPEGRDLGSDPITPDDIPFVDKELDITSHNPVENQAIAKQFAAVEESVSDHTKNKKNPHGVTATQIGAVPTSRKVNGKALSGNITLTAADTGALPTTGGTMTNTAKFIPNNGTDVITSQVYRNVPSDAPTATYMTRNVITNDGGATMQLFKGEVGAEPSTSSPVNRLTLTETDSQLLKPLTVSSGGTGTNELANAPSHAIIRKAGDGSAKLHYTETASGAFYATADNGGAKFGTLPVGQGGTGKTTHTSNAVLTGNGTDAVKNVATASGAMYATSAGGAPKFGVLPTAQGGTGTNELTKATVNAIIRKAGDGSDKLHYTSTANGAFFAKGDNSPAQFGTLPIAQGGTGATKAEDAIKNLGAVPKTGGELTGMVQFKPENGTSVITVETYRSLPNGSPTASYKTRNVIASTGAAMQFFKGAVGDEPSTEVNRLTLTETDTQLMKPLTISSGGTGAKNATDAITNLGINDYVVAQGTSGGWIYRKWNSGIAECFLSSEVVPSSGAGEKYHSVNLPFEFYNKSYHVSVTGVKAANQNYAHDFLLGDSSSNDGRTTTSIMFHFHYTLATPYSVGFTIFVMGRWK